MTCRWWWQSWWWQCWWWPWWWWFMICTGGVRPRKCTVYTPNAISWMEILTFLSLLQLVFSVQWILPSLTIRKFLPFSQSIFFPLYDKDFSALENFYHNNFCSLWEITSWVDKLHNRVAFIICSPGLEYESSWQDVERAQFNFKWISNISLSDVTCIGSNSKSSYSPRTFLDMSNTIGFAATRSEWHIKLVKLVKLVKSVSLVKNFVKLVSPEIVPTVLVGKVVIQSTCFHTIMLGRVKKKVVTWRALVGYKLSFVGLIYFKGT